jgi:hypothetical protein
MPAPGGSAFVAQYIGLVLGKCVGYKYKQHHKQKKCFFYKIHKTSILLKFSVVGV